ncbi:hypothetical protein OESDEN_16773 [Oesophagostomum dentatum]|uniref:Uncharacterized protein n=1 Tax=Oesophagostomum dentatum TaxID=61180 RepID=A0A0B1SDY8_OESDE|nr:hypothetical protein OESDEN_16773 [Oesophagostomum dentatum]
MSIDALRLISEYMTPAGRINLARINASTSKALAKWEDVHSVLFDETKIILAGEVFRHQIDTEMDLVSWFSPQNLSHSYSWSSQSFLHSMNDVFRLCPHARRVWIQKRLRQEQLQALQQHSNVIELLYISSENFDT